MSCTHCTQVFTQPVFTHLFLPSPCVERARIYSDVKDLEPSFVPLMFTNLLAENSYGVGLRFLRPFFIEKKEKCRYCCLTPWSSSVMPSLRKKLVYLPTCCALISSKPYFKFMKEALSGFVLDCIMYKKCIINDYNPH